MIEKNDIFETVDMVRQYHFDVRTVTMGISLLSCVAPTAEETARRCYELVCRRAEKLVPTAEELSSAYGVPVVNKRVSVTPVSLLCEPFGGDGRLIARALDRAGKEIGVDFVGGYSALVQKGMTEGERNFLRTIPEVLRDTDILCSSVNVGSTRSGINLDAVSLVGEIVKETARLTADREGFGCAKFVAFCNAVEDNPFMAGAFHGVGEGSCVINVGVSGPGVVYNAIRGMKDADIADIAEAVKKTAFKITRVGELIAKESAKRLGAEFGIVDLSLAPTPVDGDSVGQILEEMGLEKVGTHGTTACLAILNDAVKKGGMTASSRVGGLSGAFIPVSEDVGMIGGAESGTLTLDKLEAMTAVCSVGIDMVAVPGDTPAETIAAILADEAAIGMINNKTTAVRIIPVPGKAVGDRVDFGGLLGSAPVMAVKRPSSAKFIRRGGHIPAPIHGNKN